MNELADELSEHLHTYRNKKKRMQPQTMRHTAISNQRLKTFITKKHEFNIVVNIAVLLFIQ